MAAVFSLADLFPDEDYRFHLTLRRGEPAEFFRAQDPAGRIVAERARWITQDPARYAAAKPEAIPLIEEFASLLTGWGVLAEKSTTVAALGAVLEPDLLFLSPDATGAFRLRGGALCFPTGWALEEKLGHTLEFIHGVVPGLNAALGSPIQQFLSRLKPGSAFFRANWGLAATDELNLHPVREVARPSLPVALEQLWLRVEHQVLLALPRSRGIVFGIRIELHRLDDLTRDVKLAAGLRRALTSMPDELARYKGLAAVRAALIEHLGTIC